MGKADTEAKLVWIACRATEGCDGTQATMMASRNHQTVDFGGGFTPAAGGKSTRYRCSSCKRDFVVTT